MTTRRPFTQYISAYPLGIMLFWHADELGSWECRADVYQESSTNKRQRVTVKRDGELVELDADELTTEERVRRVLREAYRWTSDGFHSPADLLTTDQLEAARDAIRGLGDAFGIKQKDKTK